MNPLTETLKKMQYFPYIKIIHGKTQKSPLFIHFRSSMIESIINGQFCLWSLVGVDGFGRRVWLEMVANNGFVFVAWIFHGFSLKIGREGERGTNFAFLVLSWMILNFLWKFFTFVKFLLVYTWCSIILTFYFKWMVWI